MEKNVVIAIILSVVVLLGWYMIFPPAQRPVQQEQPTQEEQPESEQPRSSVEQPQETSVPVEGVLPIPDVSQRQLDEDARKVVVDTPLFYAVFTTQGARIMEWRIKKYTNNTPKLTERSFVELQKEGIPEDVLTKLETLKNHYITEERLQGVIGEEQTAQYKKLILQYASVGPVDLVSEDSFRLAQLPLEVFTGDTSLDDELNLGHYQASAYKVELQPGDEPETISLSYVTSTGVKFTKELMFSPDSYIMEMRLTFSDPSRVGKELVVAWGPGVGANLEITENRFEPGIVLKTNEKRETLVRSVAKKIEQDTVSYENIEWSALDRKYFAVAFFADNINNNKLSVKKIPLQPLEGEEKIAPIRQLLIGLNQPLTSGECRVSLYAGPKEYTRLKKLSTAYPGFNQLINYGKYIRYIAEPLVVFMNFVYGIIEKGLQGMPDRIKSYGLVIICVTILIKILFFPLTYKSFKSMKSMQDLQPKLKVLREKYKDKQQQQQEMMKLYKQEGVNPMGGCLPMVLQLPVFFALFRILSNSIELWGQPFLWINDLSVHESLPWLGSTGDYVRPLVIMMGVSMFLQQSMTPTAGDPKQAQMFKYMPIIFTALFWSFPSGLVLYWFMNNILTIGQQYLIKKGGEKFSKTTKESEQKEKKETASVSRKRRKKGK
jgi:YidC/Oxa1 family membrane protein insertase